MQERVSDDSGPHPSRGVLARAQEEVGRASNTLRNDADALEANRADSHAVGVGLREEREALVLLAGQLQVRLCAPHTQKSRALCS